MALIIHPTIQNTPKADYHFITKLDEKALEIYIGNEETRKVKEFDYIIEIANEHQLYEPLSYKVNAILQLQFDDTRKYNILQEIHKVVDFMEHCNNGKLLIHCGEGVSRSPSILIMYLIHRYKYTYLDAFSVIYSKRFIKPNVGFMKQLQNMNI
jgi:predicted protein tyrosine phosphatase